MAATTHSVPHLEVPVTDDMDLHSDSGLDFDDGDIEIDYDLPLDEPQEDDVSIKDAATDAGLDVQTVNADQDDFMIDHEDFIEEDTLQYDDGAPAVSGSGAPSVTAKTATPAPQDEDVLIDYSDDEDEPPSVHTQEPLPFEDDEVPSAHDDKSESQTQHGDAPNATNSNDTYTYDPHDLGQDEGVGIYETLYQPEANVEAEAQHQVDDHGEGDQGGIQLEGFDEQADDSEHQEDDKQDRPLCETRAITINYEGNELWLFKEHDTENSGDWLLEDISVVHSSLSELLQACRASLGEDISHETELGLRFDHLHNMELYEDNTACVAVSLERLLDLYYSLHSQDGNSDPESFYICLQSRPRFATLLADIAKHADQGSGYTGFNAAVAAGETHFVDAYSGHSTEHDATEWDNDEEQHDDTDSASGADADTVHVEHEEHEEDEPHNDGDDASEEEASDEHDKAFDAEDTAYSEQVPLHEDSAAQVHADVSEEAGSHDDNQAKTAQTGSPSASNKATEDFQDDVVDYSDDEEEDNVVKPSGVVVNDPSPSSSTVQGDDTLTGEHATEVTASTQAEGENSVHPDEDTYAHAEGQSGHVENNESYQDFDQTYTEENPFSEFQTGENEGFSAEADFDGFTNQDFTGYDYQDVDQELQNDFLGDGEYNDTDASHKLSTVDGVTGDDDYLNLTDAPEWTADQGQTLPPPEDDTLVFDDYTEHGQEEEDGLVQQPAVAASSAADPVAASSSDLHKTSPQGQKRSIDEVGDMVGDALDSTGAITLSSQRRIANADLYMTDTKRPRV
ncbi:hypothetical protein FB567DRAFT_562427 [Paraphoma chrysanthemicola]|uniref:Uncharacterized protein n=1 Tax=Paraphoma chrysanthemicola TaxID=798071 RepID=A0A8K0VWH1_9PLEO|nr:hypothetical protein FB567DRAFT_562427 [Paraphoma chrysanthemicola]